MQMPKAYKSLALLTWPDSSSSGDMWLKVPCSSSSSSRNRNRRDECATNRQGAIIVALVCQEHNTH
jgi:hypothetical protein